MTTNIIAKSTDLDVICKYTSLMQASLDSESIYARTKETLEQLFKDSAINNNDRALVLSNVLGALSSSLSTSAMSTALQWASSEVELAFKKLETEKQLDIADKEDLLRARQAEKVWYEMIAIQADTKRSYGTPVVNTVNGALISLEDAGKVQTEIQLLEAQKADVNKNMELTDARIRESYAGVHKAVADTVVNHGAWSYTLNEQGIVNTPVRTPNPTGVRPLSDVQRVIAQEQAKGYAYNAWANAVTSTAGVAGTIIASDTAGTSAAMAWLTRMENGLDKLVNNAELPVFPS